MAELLQLETGLLQQSFAGDVFNTAVYLKRAFPQLDTCLLTAVGQDSLSDSMVDFFAQENIDTQFICRSLDKIPGLYWIKTDAQGERSFTYWRNDSAARQVLRLLTTTHIEKIAQAEYFFFSGISLAVIPAADRDLLWLLLARLKEAGVKIVFDPNYRSRLWGNPEEAKVNFDQAFGFSDLLLPGVDDFMQLYGLNTIESINDFLGKYSVSEVVVKNGPEELCLLREGKIHRYAITPVSNVVDTTSAGDSFNGVYLGAKMAGIAGERALALAAKSAAVVIQHRGAIIPAPIFQEFWTEALIS